MAQRILFVVSEDWYFLSHRLPMARAAKAAGYDVFVATRLGNCAEQIAAEGFHLRPIRWKRGSINPLRLLSSIFETTRLYREIQPDLIHHVALVPTVIGSIASIGVRAVTVNALAGLGFIFTSTSIKARLLQPLVRHALRRLLRRTKSTVLVQNPDDYSLIEKLGVPSRQIVIIPGSGVDTTFLQPIPEPHGMFTVGFVGRLLADKGVQTLVSAHEILKGRGINIQTLIAGAPDPSNPASMPDRVLNEWRKIPNLVLLGHVDDVRMVWAKAHVGVLPSRREGLPKSLLEAAACGRALIASDVPGCKEVARPGVNAILVPPDDPSSLADAIQTMRNEVELRHRFGLESRKLVVSEFSETQIGSQIVNLYDALLRSNKHHLA